MIKLKMKFVNMNLIQYMLKKVQELNSESAVAGMNLEKNLINLFKFKKNTVSHKIQLKKSSLENKKLLIFTKLIPTY